MRTAELLDWGRLDYQSALNAQRELVTAIQQGERSDAIVLVEHPHVITVGRRSSALGNVLAAEDVAVVEVERGGDVTYHGPGQLIAYPILQLQPHERDLHRFLRNMEQAMIDMLAIYDLPAGRVLDKTGVWTDCASSAPRKLASMGIACRKWVTFHGLALNINTDLRYFERINPCGFASSVMTSMAAELGTPLDMQDCKARLSSTLGESLQRRI